MKAKITLCVLVMSLGLCSTAQAKDPPKGNIIAAEIVATWQCQDMLGVPRWPATRSPWKLKHHSPAYARNLYNLWRVRHAACKAQLQEWKRQWDWQSWLPAKWQRIAICETGMNWQHHNSSYQGAFGFATQSWDSFKLPGYPEDADQATPWQQYQVALQIYNRYGLSGWGCRNA